MRRFSTMPRGRFQAGRKTRAMCPRCHAWIKPGEWMTGAPGRGNVVYRHVTCPKKAG